MSQEYSNPERETEENALPDVEVFQVPEDCEPETEDGEPLTPGYYWWGCFPGCLPDGDPIGPFDTYEDALEDAQSF